MLNEPCKTSGAAEPKVMWAFVKKRTMSVQQQQAAAAAPEE